jgi:uncharacterized protein (DUF58 family)
MVTPSGEAFAPARRSGLGMAERRKGWRRRRAPRQLKFTREGRVFVLVTLGVGAAAVNTGNNLLYLVLGLLLSLIVLSGLLSETAVARLRVERRLPKRFFVGSPAVVELVVHNGKPRAPSYSVEVEDQSPADPAERRCYYLKVDAGTEETSAYRRVPTRRGPLTLTGFRVSTRYPFGLFEKSRIIDDEAEILVYPEVIPEPALEGRDRHEGNEAAAPRPGPGAEVVGLRDYRDGDEARQIHWKRTASLGRLVVRERERESARRLTLLIDNALPADLDEPARAQWNRAFEDAIGRATHVALEGLERGLAVDVAARGDASPLVLPGSPPDPLLRFLALLGPSTDPDAALEGGGGARVKRFDLPTGSAA